MKHHFVQWIDYNKNYEGKSEEEITQSRDLKFMHRNENIPSGDLFIYFEKGSLAL